MVLHHRVCDSPDSFNKPPDSFNKPSDAFNKPSDAFNIDTQCV